jgi:hypothetical protein
MWVFLIDEVIQEEGLYVYNIHNIVEKQFSINIVPVRSEGGMLVCNKLHICTQMGVADFDNIEDLKAYVEKMVLAENHDPEKFMKKKKALPVARISEETFETFLEKEIVFVNYFTPW